MRSVTHRNGRYGHQTILALTLGLAIFDAILWEGQVSAEKPQASGSASAVVERVRAIKLEASNLAGRQQYQAAMPLLDELVKLDSTQPFPPDRDLGRNLIAIATTLGPTGQYDRLEYLFKRGIQVLQNSPEKRLGDLMNARYNLAALYDQMSASASRDQTLSEIVNAAAHLQQPIDDDTAVVFQEVGRLYSSANQYKPVTILYEQVHGYMLNRYRDDSERLAAWKKTYADALASDHQFRKAVELYNEALALVDSPTTSVSDLRLDLLFRMGSAAMLGGDLSEAERALDGAKEEAQRAGLDKTRNAGFVYRGLADLYVRQKKTEKYADAEALLRQSLDIEARAGCASTVSFALGLNQLAVTLDLVGKSREAEEYYGEAIRLLEGLSGAANLEFAKCLEAFGSLLMRQQRPAEAAKHLRRALSLREAATGQVPLEIANAISNVATAYFKAGNLEEASREYWRAINMREVGSLPPEHPEPPQNSK